MKKICALNAFLGACVSLVGVVAANQISQAAVLFDITNGAAISAFAYSSAVGSNNVINAVGAPATGSTVTDASHTADWKGTASGGANSFVSVTGLSAVQTYSIQWTYIGSESGDVVQISIPALASFNEDNRNNNSIGCASCVGVNPALTKDLGTTNYANDGTNIPVFTLKDLHTGGTVTNGGSNAAPNVGGASLIFSYATFSGGLYTLTDRPTDFIVFGFNDNGGADDDHDDFMGVMTLIPGGLETTTPIPGALPLFGSVLGGALGLLGWRRKRKTR